MNPPARQGAPASRVRVDGRELRVTHLDRVLWPREGLTKAHLIDYFVRVAPLMLPHLEGRPLVLTRYPEGIERPSFYQKQAPWPRPAWVRTAQLAHEDRAIDYVLADSAATLAWLGNLAAIEIHPWMSRVDDPEHPDLVVIDLDPDPPASFEESRKVAFWVRQALDRLGVPSVPKLSGATGVHVCIPIRRRYTYEQTSRFAATVGRALSEVFPDRVTDERLVRRRHGRVYVDPYQNLRGKTVVAPYSPRPLPGAPVSMPLTWDELETAQPRAFTIANVTQWLPGRRDPLLEALGRPCSLDAFLERVPGLQGTRT
ncbi:MAG: non-homologous end-joining DNA ligase [Limnochordaceae bacterium]|nr:non-homologous end-joining DNA ligase [Limnochordaceae bacterium]